MQYIDGIYLQQKYPQVIEDLGGIVGNSVIDVAIAEAQAEVDLYIDKYLPLIEVGDFIKSLTADIAIYRAKQDESTEIDFVRYKEALRKLEAIQNGELSLGAGTVSATVGNANDSCSDNRVTGISHFANIDRRAY